MLRFICFFALIASSAINAVECPPVLRTFHIFDKTGQKSACLDEWQKSFFNELGCPIDFLNGNPTTVIREAQLREGKIELITGLSQSITRRYQFSIPFAEHKMMLFRRVADTKWDNIKEWCDSTMKQASIIVPGSGYFGKDIELLHVNPQCVKELIPSPLGHGERLNMLDKQRADLILMSDKWWNNMPVERKKQYTALKFYQWNDQLRIAFSTKVKSSFVDAVNRQLEQKVKSGVAVCQMSLPAKLPVQSAARE